MKRIKQVIQWLQQIGHIAIWRPIGTLFKQNILFKNKVYILTPHEEAICLRVVLFLWTAVCG